jgi:hypothetical protein
MAGFVFDFNEQKKAAQNAKTQSSGGGGRKIMDLKAVSNEVLILPQTVKDSAVFFETCVHEVWVNKRPVASCTSPTVFDEKDIIMEAGWNLKRKYENSKSDKLKNAWKNFMPKRNKYVYVLNKADIEAGPLLLKLPKAVYDVLLDELDECTSNEDYKSICDLDKGRWLRIKHNGAEGLNKSYIAKFSKETAQLVENNLTDEDKVAAAIPDLRKLQTPLDHAAVKKTLAALMDQFKALLKREGGEEDEDDVEYETEDDSDDIEIDEPVSKKAQKSGATKKAAKKVIDEDDFDLDEDE